MRNGLAATHAVLWLAITIVFIPDITEAKKRGGGASNSTHETHEKPSLTTWGKGIKRDAVISNKDRSNILSRAELGECLKLESSINSLLAEIAIDEPYQIQIESAIRQGADALEKSGAMVNRYNTNEVSAHNARIAEYNGALDAYNAIIPKLKERVNQVNKKVAQFNGECGGRWYYIDDMVTVEKALGIKHGN